MKCPECSGNGSHFAYINTGADSSTHRAGDVVCLRCKGSREVPDEMELWISDGKRVRALMLERGLTMMSVAAGLGVTPAEISSVLAGRVALSTIPSLEGWIVEHPVSEQEPSINLDFKTFCEHALNKGE